MTGTNEVLGSAQEAADSVPMGWAARFGLLARAVVYLIMGWLAVLVARGAQVHVDQRGALTEVLAQPFGSVLVALMCLGFAAYALWRFSEAVFGVTGEADGRGPRLKSVARGVAYVAMAATAVSLLVGARGTQAGQQGQLAASVMSTSAGRALVAVVGLAVVVVGLVMVREGWSDRFLRAFGYLPRRRRDLVVWLGRVGTVARGVVFTVTGGLMVLAALNTDPEKAGGIDAAVRSLLDAPFGPALVTALGLGLVVFGVYGVAEAAWRHVPGDRPR